MIRFARFATRLGPMYSTADGPALTGIYFEGGRHAPAHDPAWIEDSTLPALRACARQLQEYLAGTRHAFDLPLAPAGTPFQLRVWAQIARIPYGRTVSYAELARLAGAPGCARAAGAATGRNPLSIVVPCHRIVGRDGSLTGYAGGLDKKTWLLEREGARVPAAA
jgi:methylated-DNA-[protein]-cysteine S-methyltransferase